MRVIESHLPDCLAQGSGGLSDVRMSREDCSVFTCLAGFLNVKKILARNQYCSLEYVEL